MNMTYNAAPNAAPASATLSPFEIERLARRRAGAKLGWFIHAAVFVSVNALLMTISLANGKPWAFFPLMGWGLGLAIHGAVVWLGSPGSALHEWLLQTERTRLQARRDPW
jgi:2TM domain